MSSPTVSAATASPPDAPAPPTEKMSLPTLTAMVVGSMIGSGIFMLPRRFGDATGGFGALVAWAVAGGGMYTLARVFQYLAQRKPDLDAGVYAYAKAGFGNYLGFISALGYWTGSFIGNVSYFVLIMSTVGLIKHTLAGSGTAIGHGDYDYGEPNSLFGAGDTLPAVLVSSVVLWAVHFLVLRGVKQATFINKVVTVAKIVPIFLFVLIVAVAGLFIAGAGFRFDTFAANFWGGEGETKSLWGQVSATMGVVVFVFLGVEGASVYSRYAQKREHVGAATLFGFVGVTCLMVLITLLPYGVMPQAGLKEVQQPSVAGVLGHVVGPWGVVFIGAGLIVSVLGAYLAWSLIAAEVIWSAARTKDMPAVISRENQRGVPAAALWLTNLGTQVFLVSTLFSADALRLMVDLTGAMNLIPLLLVAGYGLKLTASGETYDVNPTERTGHLILAGIATLYTLFLIYALGLKFLLLGAILYAPGTGLYVWARREQGQNVFTPAELGLFVVAVAGAVLGIVFLATGYITL
jgi:arginine:ornithine antiporter/lysine permease